MKLIFIIPLCVMLGSCINTSFSYNQPETNRQSDGSSCLILAERLTSLMESLKEPQPTPAAKTKIPFNRPIFSHRPKAPALVIKVTDNEEQMLAHIENLVSHIEVLNRYIDDEQRALLNSYGTYLEQLGH